MTRFELLADSAAETINGGIDDIDVRNKSVRASLRQLAVNSSVTVGRGRSTSQMNQIGGVLVIA
jgi:hypothetical protein